MRWRALGAPLLEQPERDLVAVVEAMDRAADRLNIIAEILGKMLALGAAPTALLVKYNAAALSLREGQRMVIDFARRIGMPGVAADAPWPPIFADQAVSQTGQISLPQTDVLLASQATVYNAPPGPIAGSDGETTLAFPWLAVGIAAGAGLTAYFGFQAWRDVRTKELEAEVVKLAATLKAQAYELRIANIQWRAAEVQAITKGCTDKLGPQAYLQCLRNANGVVEQTPDLPDLGEAMKKAAEAMRHLKKQDGHGFLWWFGFTTVAVATGAAIVLVAKRWHEKRQKAKGLRGHDEDEYDEDAA